MRLLGVLILLGLLTGCAAFGDLQQATSKAMNPAVYEQCTAQNTCPK